jgi:hypothetical protein
MTRNVMSSPDPEPLAPPYDAPWWPPDEYDLPDTEDEHQQDAAREGA